MNTIKSFFTRKTKAAEPLVFKTVRVETRPPRNPEEPNWSYYSTQKINMTDEQLKNYEPLEISDPMPYGNPRARSRNRRAKITTTVYFPKKRAAILKEHLNKMKQENKEYEPIAREEFAQEQRRREEMEKKAKENQAKYFTEVLGRGGKRKTRKFKQKSKKTRKH